MIIETIGGIEIRTNITKRQKFVVNMLNAFFLLVRLLEEDPHMVLLGFLK
jgi:hypothetical protein